MTVLRPAAILVKGFVCVHTWTYVLGRAGTGVQIWTSNRLVAQGYPKAHRDCLHFNVEPQHKVSKMFNQTKQTINLRQKQTCRFECQGSTL